MSRTALVTGASSGIGAATTRRLVAEGFDVVAAARRRDRLDALAAETGARAITLDVTSEASVTAMVEAIESIDVVVNNAGGALGFGPISTTDVDEWRRMYDTNVLGSLRVTKALLSRLAAGDGGHVVMVTSIAGHVVYEGGSGYNAAKYAQAALTEALRLELNGWPVRITEIVPGMVQTEEFSLVRFGGDAERAAKVYEDVVGPLVAEDIADAITWALTRPAHVNIDRIDVKPLAQAAAHKLHRGPFRLDPISP